MENESRHEPIIVTAVLTEADRRSFNEMNVDALIKQYYESKLSGSELSRKKRKRVGDIIKDVFSSLCVLALGVAALYTSFSRPPFTCASCFTIGLGVLMLFFFFLGIVTDIKRAKPKYRLADTAEEGKGEICTFVFGDKRLFIYSERKCRAYYYYGIPNEYLELDNIIELADGLAIKAYDSCYWLPARFIDPATGERLLERIAHLPAGNEGKPHLQLSKIRISDSLPETPPPFFARCAAEQPIAELTPHPEEIDDITVTQLALYGDGTLALVEDGDTLYIPAWAVEDIRRRTGKNISKYNIIVGSYDKGDYRHLVTLAPDGSDDAAAADFFARITVHPAAKK